MAIIYTHQKSKKRKPNAKQRMLKASWEELLKKYEPKKPVKIVEIKKIFSATVPPGRETPKYPSVNTGGVATKPVAGNVYTGTKMKGIGTLHKSNAVPIFTDEEAKDQATMRR